MKKKLFVFLALFMFAFQVFALNETSSSNNEQLEEVNGLTTIFKNDDVTLNKKYNSTLIVGGNSIHNTSIIDGINVGLANFIEDNTNSEYALLAGSTVNVENIVKKDLFVLGSSVRVNSTVNRDMFIYGQMIDLSGNYKRNVVLYGQSIILNNVEIKGNVLVKASSITLGENVIIDGTLKYNDDIEIKGNLVNIQTESYTAVQSKAQTMTSFLVNLGSYCVLFLVLIFIAPKMFTYINEKIDNSSAMYPIILMGKGAFALIASIMLVIISMMFVVGVYVGIAIIAIFLIIAGLSTLYSAYYIGRIVWTRVLKKQDNTLFIGFIGIVIISLINLLPVIAIFTTLMGMGLILDNIDLKKLRN